MKRNFPPNYRKTLTEKFYAKHQALPVKWSDPRKDLRNLSVRTPQAKQSSPATENQVYGWLWQKSIQYDAADRELFYHPRKTDELMKIFATLNVQKRLWKRNSYN